EAGLEALMAERDGEDDDAEEVLDGEVIAAPAARVAQPVEELLVGQDPEQLSEGGELGMVFEAEPGGQGGGGGQAHWGSPGAAGTVQRKGHPVQAQPGVRIAFSAEKKARRRAGSRRGEGKRASDRTPWGKPP